MAAADDTRLIDVSTPRNPRTFVLVDACDYEFLNQWKWNLSSEGYAIRTVRVDGKDYIRRMHRIIADAPEGVMVDHINGDKLDNRRCNLRYANAQKNSINRRSNLNRRYKGAYRNHAGTYEAKLHHNGKLHYLGCFRTEEEAARAYDAAAKIHFGEFARLNFPDSEDAA